MIKSLVKQIEKHSSLSRSIAARSLLSLRSWGKRLHHTMRLVSAENLEYTVPSFLEGNAKQVVEAVNSTDCTWSRLGHHLVDTCWILYKFSRWRYGFVNWEANYTAQQLAKTATKDIIDSIWRDQIPYCICDVVLMEQYN